MRGAAFKSPRALSKLSFLLCPQTPDLAFCEAKAKPFNLIPGGVWGARLNTLAEFEPRSARVGRSLRGVFVCDGGAQKTLTIYWASPNRLSFSLCPQTPDLAFCEAKAKPFNLIPGGYGGRSERHQWAEGSLVLSERSPPSRTKLPRSACPTCAERRGNHRVRSQFANQRSANFFLGVWTGPAIRLRAACMRGSAGVSASTRSPARREASSAFFQAAE